MDQCDVLIVGGGPAGSSCAWAMRESGLDVLLVDRAVFPREKLCGGWITPLVLEELEIDIAEYEDGRTMQPITGFRIGCIGDAGVEIACGETVSYGIRRCEFDTFLLRRSGARIREGYNVTTVERDGRGWLVNGEIWTRMLVGAGGHFCPVTRLTGPKAISQAVVAREVEFRMAGSEAEACGFRGETPELYFCRDMKGYGWCFRKGSYLNIGLGRLDQHRLPEHVEEFVEFLKRERNLRVEREMHFAGHAYFLFGHSQRKVVDDGLLLIGDAAGLAFAQSGEGIRPAIESGLLAAETILAGGEEYSREKLAGYENALEQRYVATTTAVESSAKYIPRAWRNAAARVLLRQSPFARFVVKQWFLREDEAALARTAGPKPLMKSA